MGVLSCKRQGFRSQALAECEERTEVFTIKLFEKNTVVTTSKNYLQKTELVFSLFHPLCESKCLF